MSLLKIVSSLPLYFSSPKISALLNSTSASASTIGTRPADTSLGAPPLIYVPFELVSPNTSLSFENPLATLTM